KDGKANIGFTVLHNELPTTLAVLRPLAAELGATVEHEEEVSKISIVGTGMRTHTGVAERMFAALSAAEVNMKMITTGDIKISVLVAREDGVKGLRAVHQAFHLHEARPGAGMPAVVYRPRGAGAFRKAADESKDAHADPEIAKLFVLGVGMRTHTGVARRMFGALAERDINIGMINTSEVRVSVVVDRERGEEALGCLKAAFNVP